MKNDFSDLLTNHIYHHDIILTYFGNLFERRHTNNTTGLQGKVPSQTQFDDDTYRRDDVATAMRVRRRLINNLADISDKAIPAKRRDTKNGYHRNTMKMT